MTRSQCYDILFRLKKERNLDIDAAIETLAENDTVPESVIKFIEDNSTRTFRDFMLVISKSKPFYGNIVFNYTDNIEKYIKAMLSFLIHIKITLVKNPNLIQEFNEHFNIKEITNMYLSIHAVRINAYAAVYRAGTRTDRCGIFP